MLVGYARVSTTDQSNSIQTDTLTQHGVERLFEEQQSGKTADNRPILQQCLDFVREGDVLVVTRLDRIARSARDLHNVIHTLNAKGVGFRCLQQGEMDTTTSHGKLLLGVLALMAEFELDIRQERQREGIVKAKAAGVYKGRKATINRDEVAALKASGLGPRAIAKQLKCSEASIYRILQPSPVEAL
ncbi:recombinase family protein [Sphingobium limneticum]|uniref:Helix-turn-helix domain-containing protein n=1 Tax=Sphingobium limneticum TaxID=1007511 RepID=A0A5J5I851_9SPHN|nr:recombinase family protein [Sphingobium limneticum]KAA9018270.1 helix-turn-helix domain-containing protein [Sphingobium limneticum]KAA9030906.1 helix-turn-helix domain-containing protein [Sphingobium limneticum]